MDRGTVSVHFVRAAVARLTQPARERVLVTAGIPPTLWCSEGARVPAGSFAALWLAVSRELDDEFFGLDRRRMKVGSFALLCHAVLPSVNIDRALKQIVRAFGVLLDDLTADLSLRDGEAVISIESRIEDPASSRFAQETLLVMLHGLMCWLAGRRISLNVAAFAFARPSHAEEYVAMFASRLGFGAERTEVRFDASLLGLPVVQNQRTLKEFLRTAPQSVFLKYRNESGFATRLRHRLRRCVGTPDWPTLEELAVEWGVSATTLRRRLMAEASSFQDMKNEVRRDGAIELLCGSAHSVAEIGDMLGFKDTSAFRRAFKTWTDVQPVMYRRRSPKRSG